MKKLLLLLPFSLLAGVALTSCGSSSPSYNPDIGPFDEDGNYIEEWADNPPFRGNKSRTVQAPTPVTTPTITKPRQIITVAPKPRQIATVAPKPTTKTTHHLVKKGDTLYALSRKYGTTVSAIQKANGISGTSIHTGRTYIIP